MLPNDVMLGSSDFRETVKPVKEENCNVMETSVEHLKITLVSFASHLQRQLRHIISSCMYQSHSQKTARHGA